MIRNVTLLTLIFLTACSKPRVETDPQYKQTINDWHQKRVDRLFKPTGWLNLVGLEWLKEGPNSMGSHDSCDVRLPAGRAPAFCGILDVENGAVTLKADPSADIKYNGEKIREMVLRTDVDSGTTTLELGSLRFYIIKRSPRLAVRVRDLESPLLKTFAGIERFAVDKNWRLEATLEPYDPPKIIPIPTIIPGIIDSSRSPGAIRFEYEGTTYRLDAVAEDGSDEYFMIVGDKTNGNTTYGGGRYIYIPKADSSGKTVLDFNKLYNPPCVFTDFATCPFPPLQNRLPIEITAGEKTYGHH